MTATDVELMAGEQLMSTADELAYRQMTPHMFQDDGRIATSVFGPSTADNGKPSYSRSSSVSPQEARDWHTLNASKPSMGVYAVSVGEVISSGRYAVDDSECPLAEDEKRAPGHCFVDFRGLSRSQKKDLRAQLYMHAMVRGEIPTKSTAADGELLAL